MNATTTPSPHRWHPRKAGRAERKKPGKRGGIADFADPVLRQRANDLCDKMLDKIERIFDVIAPPPVDDPREPVPPGILRWTADMMALWHLCPHEACRRARCCRRKPTTCVMRGTPLVPNEVRKGAATLLRGRRDGLPYEEVRAAARDDVVAVELWLKDARTSPTPKRHTRGDPLSAKSGSGTAWCARAADGRRTRPAH